MLVLSRKPGEKVVIGNGITVTVLAVTGNKVRLAFDAPDQGRILRGELSCWRGDPAACGEPVDPACPSGESKLSDRHGEEVVRLVTAGSPQEAHRWRQALEGQGIGCRVVGEPPGGFGVVYPGHPVPELWVHRDHAARAQAVLQGLQDARPR
jgi:carbon storage regulator CsrA